MFSKLSQLNDRYQETEQLLTVPEIVSDHEKYTRLIKEYNQLAPLIEKYREYLDMQKTIAESEAILGDADADGELRLLAEEELYSAKDACARLTEELKLLLIPKDPRDEKNVIVEIRAGTGGEEAALFAADLYRMYCMYADAHGFKISVLGANETDLGGYKEITFQVKGTGAFSRLKFESGVHRVQRVPVTESNGRIQTSAVTVAVLAEVDAVEIEISPSELKYESCKSSGAGGQHINKTESAVRLTHLPTGLVIECDCERSQLRNKETALAMLRAKLYDIKERERTEKIASERRSQVGSGDRSEKIRTYNFPQSRVTDHRINKTLYSLDEYLKGEMDGIISELIATDTAERMRADEGSF